MQKHVNCGAFGSVDKITCHMGNFQIQSVECTDGHVAHGRDRLDVQSAGGRQGDCTNN